MTRFFPGEPSITERQADMMLGLIRSLDTVIYCDAEIDDIIREDAGAFLAGERSLGTRPRCWATGSGRIWRRNTADRALRRPQRRCTGC